MERIHIKPTDRVVVFTGAGMSADLATNEYVAIVRQRAAACPNVDDTGARGEVLFVYAGRRGAATLLVQLTGNAVASQYVLRHKNIATTQAFYVKPVQTAAVEGLRLLESKLAERKTLSVGAATESNGEVSE
jgi:hypothetical protein